MCECVQNLKQKVKKWEKVTKYNRSSRDSKIQTQRNETP